MQDDREEPGNDKTREQVKAVFAETTVAAPSVFESKLTDTLRPSLENDALRRIGGTGSTRNDEILTNEEKTENTLDPEVVPDMKKHPGFPRIINDPVSDDDAGVNWNVRGIIDGSAELLTTLDPGHAAATDPRFNVTGPAGAAFNAN